ncbi:hypothetical protein THAOC_34828 [Thalassiosira oceanica]|uniref:Uncharacterized protein n=1 Tax=Thalassiosira oceanica TaxID=159749 RepID=K0R4C8_THAOC|nr:hypothetical protein THAOC_34828 [Thalassiosira oceanica]|eukprot:EJK46499.1 hypothetical protein THAOC_34828 [Thalassiosira oceanica]
MVMWTTATADAICNSSAASSVASLTWEPGNPFYRAFIFVNTISCVVLAASVCTHNVSQVDKLWSVLPSIYAWMCVVDSRTLLMALLSTIWSVRLTYNFHRRGGYSWPPWRGEEDYRWEILRTGKPRLNRAFDQLTRRTAHPLEEEGGRGPDSAHHLKESERAEDTAGSWTARGGYRTHEQGVAEKSSSRGSAYWRGIVAAVDFDMDMQSDCWSSHRFTIFTNPPTFWCLAQKASRVPAFLPELPLDVYRSAVLRGLVLLHETRADNEQLDFQTRKQKWKKNKNVSISDEKEFVDGFNQSGLFAIVRKPNYAAEQAIWIAFYIFSLAATRDMGWNWSGGGFVNLCLLFQGSGWLTEKISSAKYPEYQAYQKRVPLYVPNLLRLFTDDKKHK